ncbi:bleomycin resistance protein [Rosenbergiella epipactidis]|uniref:bleomycin resistance protein n=1 Tax=Rosenbergiella epipactidis TaxID=1544694 RepID=UPI001F4E326A
MSNMKEVYWNKMVPELTVKDFMTSLNFYTGVLGFSIRIQRTEPNFAYICLGEAQLMLEEYHSSGWNIANLVRPLGCGVNFQIEVDNVEKIFNRVVENDITLYRALTDNFYSIGLEKACQREFLIQDPDGYLLRFSQYIE